MRWRPSYPPPFRFSFGLSQSSGPRRRRRNGRVRRAPSLPAPRCLRARPAPRPARARTPRAVPAAWFDNTLATCFCRAMRSPRSPAMHAAYRGDHELLRLVHLVAGVGTEHLTRLKVCHFTIRVLFRPRRVSSRCSPCGGGSPTDARRVPNCSAVAAVVIPTSWCCKASRAGSFLLRAAREVDRDCPGFLGMLVPYWPLAAVHAPSACEGLPGAVQGARAL